jgi:uncharacterized tellurite resistance protein B-like protein
MSSDWNAPQNVLDELQAYQLTHSKKEIKLFQAHTGTPYAEHAHLHLLSDRYLTAITDGELHPKELEAIYKIARILDISEENFVIRG